MSASLNENLLIPELLREAPHVRPILDRYGLRGCGGPDGPRETLGFFARAHDVVVGDLLEELRAGVSQGVIATELPGDSRWADTVYRPFFKSGIAIVLSLGAAWGAYLLLRIAYAESFSAVGLHEVNAHGQAQIFGWVGLFVMGFAYQAFPRFKHASLSHPRLAHASLWLMLAGIVGRSVGEAFVGAIPELGMAAVTSSVLEIIAVGLFVWIVAATWRSSGKALAVYDFYIASALFWFIVQAVGETLYLAATLRTASSQELLGLVATWQAALRDVQIHGFAMLMILGVSQRIFHHFYGLPEPDPRKSLLALFFLNAAILGEALGLILMRLAGHAWAGLWYLSVLILGGTVVYLVKGWHIYSRPEESDRSLKFLRTAYAWLFFSLALLVLYPVYQWVLPELAPGSYAAQIGFSHAYYGAGRHAITVGFISLMIMGVAAKIVPTLNGIDIRALRSLWLPFVLVNIGCALRVSTQIWSDISPEAYRIAGISGLLEVTGLAIWGVHLWRIMAGRMTGIQRDRAALLPGRPITGSHRVGDILAQYPDLLDTFLAFGFRPLANPALRKTLARQVTLSQACRLMNVDLQQLLDTLNRARDRAMNGKIELPVMEL
jgi:hypothetical protein